MLIEELNKNTWDDLNFKRDYEALIRGSLRQKLRIENSFKIELKVVMSLLRAAIHFSVSNDHSIKEAAYRIAVCCLSLNIEADAKEEIEAIVKIIFNRLGNFPATKLTFSRIEYSNISSLSLWYECELKLLQNTVESAGGVHLYTDFQNLFRKKLEENSRILSVSAPTSAGKSFVLKNFVLNKLQEIQKGFCIFIVPSRALINQVYEDFLSSITANLKSNIFISTVPINATEFKENTGLYILTQERLQTLLEIPEILRDIKFVVVDEAQNISSDSRGVILHSTIDKIVDSNPETKFIFSCPYAENTQIFNTIFADVDLNNTASEVVAATQNLEEQSSPVAQNLIAVNVDLEAQKMKFISPRFGFSTIGESQIKTSGENLLDENTLLSIVATQVSQPPTIVYCPGAAACEDMAKEICNRLDIVEDDELKEFSEFIKAQVHPNFTLAEAVLHRVAFHYGPLPAIIRRSIEDLFAKGKIHYLVCTSTLLQGVNLPAKNLFVMSPTKGSVLNRPIPLTGAEFWNLAGRAGRLRQELEGNVFLVNHNKWVTDPLQVSQKYSIKPAYIQGLQERTKLLSMIGDTGQSSGSNQLEESTFMKLVIDQANGKLEKNLERYPIEEHVRKDYIEKIQKVTASITLPSAVYSKNPSVSVYRQQSMYDYLLRKIVDEASAKDRIPVHPNGDSYHSIARMFKRIHTQFEIKAEKDKSQYFFSTVALGWMRGNTIANLIQSQIDHKIKTKVRMHGANPTIRDVLKIIENDLRFRYVKFTKCYFDILCYVLEQKKLSHLIEKIPSISLYLELGCSSKNMINLIGLGLSRTTASLLTDHLPKDEMKIEEIKEWLDRETWNKLSIPKVCIKEIQRLVRG